MYVSLVTHCNASTEYNYFSFKVIQRLGVTGSLQTNGIRRKVTKPLNIRNLESCNGCETSWI